LLKKSCGQRFEQICGQLDSFYQTSKMNHKLIFSLTSLVIANLGYSADQLTIAATAIPNAEILEFIKAELAKQGVDLQIKVFTDYVQPNVQVAEKHLDANFFQHLPFLKEFNKNRNQNLVPIVPVYIAPFGAYSAKVKDIKNLPDNARVAIPNDPSNSGRSLQLLSKAGLIKLRDPANILATTRDVVANPKHLKFTEAEAATLPRILGQVDLALINTNYALAAKVNPTKDALVIEDSHSPYANYLVARPDNKDRSAIKTLAVALNSQEVKKFIETKYNGAIVPTF
jgi:D-methionine transport system substrate-binding protein